MGDDWGDPDLWEIAVLTEGDLVSGRVEGARLRAEAAGWVDEWLAGLPAELRGRAEDELNGAKEEHSVAAGE